MKSFNSFVCEKSESDNKSKYDKIIKDLEKLNKDGGDVKEIIAMLKRSRDLKESFEDSINVEAKSNFLRENNIEV